MTQAGKLVVIDAIDGAGKSTAIGAMVEWLKSQGKKPFDLIEFQKTHHRLPELEELGDANLLLSAEPTYSWVGAAIREELIKEHPDRTYDGKTTALAFALDRHILFSSLILPFLQRKPDAWVIQDRGAISSLAYQPLQDPNVTLDWLLTLDGNKLELSRPPDILLLLRLAPEEAMKRLDGRTEKLDGHIYEQATFQERLAARYRDPAVLAPYKNAGTPVVEVDASKTREEVGAACVAEIQRL